MPGMFTTGFKEAGVDIGTVLVEKSYLIDVYPQLTGNLVLPSLWVWGRNNASAALGDNTIANKSSPVQTVAGGTNWRQASAGGYYSAGIKTDGTLWTWGENNAGQLGDNTTTQRSSPVQTVAGGTNWKQVSCGFVMSGIKTDGTLWLWGYGPGGALGDNTSISKSSPVQTVAGGTNWKQVASRTYHAAAIKTDGTLWIWGDNFYGGLGDNTVVKKSSPIQTVAAGTTWKQVMCGEYHTTAIKTDGTLWSWGYNGTGALGDNSLVHKSSPVQTIAGGTNWKQVSASGYHTAAIKTDGTLWNWGQNTSGELGDNTIANKSSPVQTVSGGTNWRQVSAGRAITSGIKTNGTLWIWGQGDDGELGDNTIANKSSPVQTVAGGTNWKQVSCGGYHTLALKDTDY